VALFRVSRERKGPDHWVNAKIAIFCAGACVALIGMALDRRWVVNVAVGILLVGVVLRFVKPASSREDEEGAQQ
jgi:hypothetical protein